MQALPTRTASRPRLAETSKVTQRLTSLHAPPRKFRRAASRGRLAVRSWCRGAPGRARLLTLSLFWLGCFSLVPGFEAGSIGQEPASVGSAQLLPASVDLRPAFEKWGLARRTQGKRGTCSVFTIVGALEFAAANQQRHGERFSVEFLNWAASRIVGKDKDGGFFSDLWKAFASYGVCAEKTLPYRAEFDPALAPGPEALAEAKTRLALGLRHHWIKEWNVKTGLTDEQFADHQAHPSRRLAGVCRLPLAQTAQMVRRRAPDVSGGCRL